MCPRSFSTLGSHVNNVSLNKYWILLSFCPCRVLPVHSKTNATHQNAFGISSPFSCHNEPKVHIDLKKIFQEVRKFRKLENLGTFVKTTCMSVRNNRICYFIEIHFSCRKNCVRNNSHKCTHHPFNFEVSSFGFFFLVKRHAGRCMESGGTGMNNNAA